MRHRDCRSSGRKGVSVVGGDISTGMLAVAADRAAMGVRFIFLIVQMLSSPAGLFEPRWLCRSERPGRIRTKERPAPRSSHSSGVDDGCLHVTRLQMPGTGLD